MQNQPQLTKAVEVFYSYAHSAEDEALKEMLLKHLAGVERQGVIVSWHDRKITAGQEWAGRIDGHIDTAGVILLLVSPDFMASGYCNDVELKRAMERHEAGEARVIPVIMRPTLWAGAPFERLQMLPKDARAVTLWPNRDEALLNVAEGILKAVREVASQTSPAEGKRHPAANIPRPPVVGFVARRDEQGRDIVGLLTTELAPDKSQLVALWGPGGSGKTTLAAEFARANADAFNGRIAWVSALGRADFTLATLLDETATRLGREDLRKLAPDPKAAEVAALVSNAPTLLILDNFETIAADEQSRCLDFLAQSALCPALITTRSRVNRDDVYNVPLAAMTTEEARDFLQRLVERTRKPSNFDRLDRDDLIRHCEANPIVLEWVVRQIDLAKRPQDVLDNLARGEGDAAARVFTRSFNLPQLGDDGRAALLALSLFTPHASREALAEVAGFGHDLRRLNKAVENLSALWLIETTIENERLFLRGLTRDLAKSRLLKGDMAGEFWRRYIAYFLRYAQGHSQPTSEDMHVLAVERENLSEAMDGAAETRDWWSLMEIRSALEDFLFRHGYWNEALKSAEQAIRAAREVRVDINSAYFKMCVAKIRRNLGEYEKARSLYQEAMETFSELEDEGNVAACLNQLGLIAQEEGDLEEAKRLYTQSLEIKKRLGDERSLALTSWNLGSIHLIQGDIVEAKRLLAEALDTFTAFKDEANVAGVLNELAVLAQVQDDYEEAKRLYNESLSISKRHGDQKSIAITLSNLGIVAIEQDDKTEAARLFLEALCIFERLGSPLVKRARAHLMSLGDEST